jgi:tetratricopeptide (TPR) repeat protein
MAVALIAGLASMALGRWAPNPAQTTADPAPQHRDSSIPSGGAARTLEAAQVLAVAPALDKRLAPPASVTPSAPARKAVSARPPMPDLVAPSPLSDGLQLAYDALAAGQYERATQLYEESLRTRPEERDALLGLAHIAQRAGYSDQALAYYQRVLRQDPQHAVAHAGVLALDRKADLSQIASQARDRAEQQPNSAVTAAALGQILVRQGRLAEAATAFARAQRLEPGNAGYSYNLAVAQDRLHQYPQARAGYERAMSLSALSAVRDAHGFSREAVQQRLQQLQAATADERDGRPCKHDGAAGCAPTEVAER